MCGGGGRGCYDAGRFDGEVKRRDLGGGYRGSREAVSHFFSETELEGGGKRVGEIKNLKRDEEEKARGRGGVRCKQLE